MASGWPLPEAAWVTPVARLPPTGTALCPVWTKLGPSSSNFGRSSIGTGPIPRPASMIDQRSLCRVSSFRPRCLCHLFPLSRFLAERGGAGATGRASRPAMSERITACGKAKPSNTGTACVTPARERGRGERASARARGCCWRVVALFFRPPGRPSSSLPSAGPSSTPKARACEHWPISGGNSGSTSVAFTLHLFGISSRIEIATAVVTEFGSHGCHKP